MNTATIFIAVFLWESCLLPSSGQTIPEPVVTAQCSFPAFMAARLSWESRISQSRSVVGMMWKFDSNTAQVTDVTASLTYKYSCIDSTSADATGNTVLVRVVSYIPPSYNDVNNQFVASTGNVMGYQCFRFVKRSQYVVQIWKSTVSSTVNPVIRLCDQLVLDQFPLVYSSLDGENSNTPESLVVPTNDNKVGGTGCALFGGYRFTLQPAGANFSDTRSILCNDIPLLPVMESDCGCTEGQPSISVDFRQWFCAGSLGLPLVGTVYCIGSWMDPASNYIFSIVSDAAKVRSKLWLFRLPPTATGRAAFVGHVTTEISTLIDDKMTPLSSADVAYAIRMTPTTYGEGICNDEAPGLCNSAVCNSNLTANDVMRGLHLTKTSCQQTCGSCVKDSGNFSNCQFTGSSMWLVGSWAEVSSNSKRQRTVNVGMQTFSFASGNSAVSMIANCLNFSTGRQSANIGTRFPVATVDPSTGCRARYACIELTQRSQSVMTYRVGRALLWPHVPTISFPSQLGANMLCSDSMFQKSSTTAYARKAPTPDVTYLDMAHDLRALIRIPSGGLNQLYPVSCGLPSSAWLLLNGQLPGGDSLSATIDQCGSNGRQDLFRYTLASGVSENHQCLASFVDSDTDDHYIITTKPMEGSTVSGDSFFCWMFQQRALFGVPNQVFLTKASDCNANTGLRVRSRTFGGYIAAFQVVIPPETDFSIPLFGSALPVVRSCVSFNLPTVATPPSTTILSTTTPSSGVFSTVSGIIVGSNATRLTSRVSSTVAVISTLRTTPSNIYGSRSSDNNQMLSTVTANLPSLGQSTVYKRASRTFIVFAVVVTSMAAILSTGYRLCC